MKKNNLFYVTLMHAGFFIYSGYAILGKLAAKEEFLSLKFVALYGCVFLFLGLYALIWQQVLKHFSLVTAVANKTVTIIWGILFGKLIFNEQIKPNMIAGSVVILLGIALLCTEKENSRNSNNEQQI
ncbi:MAG: transporter [Treponema sp.]|nr:transporter [Treponema sp.]